MGPHFEVYLHPWLQEDYHTWDTEVGIQVFRVFYRYPETPDYGFFVKCTPGMFEVGPVRFNDGIAERSGTSNLYSSHENVTDHVEKMYLKEQSMEKVYDLIDLILAPF